MKLVTMTLIFVFSISAHANLLCVDESGDFKVQIKDGQDGSAELASTSLTAIGSFERTDAPCPTRLCGSWDASYVFDQVITHLSEYYDLSNLWVNLHSNGYDARGTVYLNHRYMHTIKEIPVTCTDVTSAQATITFVKDHTCDGLTGCECARAKNPSRQGMCK